MTDCYCLFCHKSMTRQTGIKDMFYIDDVLCSECRGQLIVYKKEIVVNDIKIFSIYPYQGLFREMLLQYKQLNDEALFPLFLYPFIKEFKKKYQGYTLVQIPSSLAAIDSRGFEHVKQMFSIIDMPCLDLFEKTSEQVQKNMPYEMRNIGNQFSLKADIYIKDRKILLVDDIVTSGNSMKMCYNLINGKCAKISCFSLGYNTRYLKKYDKILLKLFF